MNPASTSRSGGREPRDSATEVDTKHKKTPETDLQGEDAGTPASGNRGDQARGTAAESAMKQTSKTGSETGSKR